ncbi:hypothetical protein [Chamaesiphon sp. OTE_8_metabat_110]|uniref:hypothetical protein n=1 Tax=Chamaesiphon sp. OTE_8_metabat_110 TaxID=2964696 RepID=UPI00286D48A0|nr:hypothetical protein [Chamaesiphon sp. OTE_8_metabat_110]
MALTIHTTRTLAAGYTQQQLYDELKAALQVAGFSAPIDENGSPGTTMDQVYSITYNAAAKGTVFFRIQIATSFLITPNLFDTYNSTTNTGTNTSITPLTYAPLNTQQLNIITINNPEMRGLALVTGSTELGFLGVIRPATKVAEWDEALWTFAFIPGVTTGKLRTVAAPVCPPIASSLTCNFGFNQDGTLLTTPSAITGKSDIFPFGILVALGAATAASYAGAFSADLALVQGSGRIQGDTFDNQWIYLGRNIAHRFAI